MAIEVEIKNRPPTTVELIADKVHLAVYGGGANYEPWEAVKVARALLKVARYKIQGDEDPWNLPKPGDHVAAAVRELEDGIDKYDESQRSELEKKASRLAESMDEPWIDMHEARKGYWMKLIENTERIYNV